MRNIPENYLFAKNEWFPVCENQKARMAGEIDALDQNRTLNSPIDDLSQHFVQKFSIDVPTLIEDKIQVDQREAQIEIRGDPFSRLGGFPNDTHTAIGTTIEVVIPFSGDGGVFHIRPTTASMNPPRATVRDQTLVMEITGANLDPPQVKRQIETAIAEIKTHLDRLRSDVVSLHNQLPGLARSRLDERRKKLLGDQNLVASLGFALKQRANYPTTYVPSEIRRKIQAVLPPPSKTSFKPEPSLSMDDYEHILQVMTNMALVMERSPSAFVAMDEESLRSHFLVQLNGHYEGQATGETFNYDGKTDILIRSDGRNLFIAECKFWDGPKKLLDTISQLLGYLSWRDNKAAVVIFNRQKDFSRVLATISEAAKTHPNFKRDLGQRSETNFRCVFANPSDANRETTVTIMAFDIPKGG
jgi:hypothetical protein